MQERRQIETLRLNTSLRSGEDMSNCPDPKYNERKQRYNLYM